ncbi:hypothetical protein K437DRAFT_260355 [Tilletiaria anomala UBC 951]|uniref:SCP domain-containing protein n=1 Tax=Tilletiaria anomala (strain ATCC 24038 / CBS 436.72 / UBC 951) TaxID=1037660 RepID=A0A066V5K9_TILAU|nr:uncharacterized protein K437DRAFT_260355 [Tilletiaria anomala UBC 951]KDN35533.1 hypothetical protein K437DRAFT_260355 [Tilletiaria anomala UBC 951]
MARLALAFVTFSVAAASAWAAGLADLYDENVAMVRHYEAQGPIARGHGSVMDILKSLEDDPLTAAALSDMDLSELTHKSTNSYGYPGGSVTITVDNSSSNHANYSGNTGTIINDERIKRSLLPAPRPVPAAAPKAAPAAAAPAPAAAPKAAPAAAAPKAAAPAGGFTSSIRPAAAAPKAAPARAAPQTVNVTKNSLTMNKDQSTNNAAQMNHNSGQIQNSGNTYGVYNACTVMIEERSFVDEVLQARDQSSDKQGDSKPQGDHGSQKANGSGTQDILRRRGRGGANHCACNCGIRRRSSGVVEIASPNAHSLEARLEPSCSILKNTATGQHHWSGSCANSTLDGRSIISILREVEL